MNYMIRHIVICIVLIASTLSLFSQPDTIISRISTKRQLRQAVNWNIIKNAEQDEAIQNLKYVIYKNTINMSLSSAEAREISSIESQKKEDKIQNWVFRKIKRAARRGKYSCYINRTLTQSTIEALKYLGFTVNERTHNFPARLNYTLIKW